MRYLHKVVGPVLGNLKSLAEKGTVIYTLPAWLMFLHILHNSFFFFYLEQFKISTNQPQSIILLRDSPLEYTVAVRGGILFFRWAAPPLPRKILASAYRLLHLPSTLVTR